MRKLKMQMQLSIDGFVAGPNSEMDWMVWNWDEPLKKYVTDLHLDVDSIVLGSAMAPGFIPHWEKLTEDPTGEQYDFARKMTDVQKVVFTKSMEKSEWNNTVLAKGDLKEEIEKLKTQDGGDIIVYGGARFVSSLIKEGLIDELHFFINPSIIGKGLPIFQEVQDRQSLQLINATAFECGIAVLVYKTTQSA